jgi:hypothetical protein
MKNDDIEQIRAVMQATYAAISGPAGMRDWDAHARQAVAECRSHVLHRGDRSGRLETMTEAQYRASRDPFFRTHSFWETETRCDVLVEGDVAVAMSHYESRWKETEPPFETGVNAVQLVRLDGEWKIVSIMWTAGQAAREVARS